ncbi:MAG TPA: invasion associated locus B family protein [Devosiaceae bacterium]|nr:invasion associated locus B family protein [Devosiaceae bacterium]
MKFGHRILAAACLAGALCSSSAVFADDAQPPAPAAAAATPSAATAARPAVPAPPAAVQAWAKVCDPAPDGHKICLVHKLVFKGNIMVAELTFRIDTAKGVPTLGIAAVPVGTLLKPGLLWQIDKQKGVAVPFWRCTPQACEAQQLVKADYIAKLKKASTLTLTALNIENHPISIDVPLQGFGDAFDQQNAPTFAEYTKQMAAAQQQAKPAQ